MPKRSSRRLIWKSLRSKGSQGLPGHWRQGAGHGGGIEAEVVAFIAATSKSKTRAKPRASGSPDWPMSQTMSPQVIPWNVSAKMNFQRARPASSWSLPRLAICRQARKSAAPSRVSQSNAVSRRPKWWRRRRPPRRARPSTTGALSRKDGAVRCRSHSEIGRMRSTSPVLRAPRRLGVRAPRWPPYRRRYRARGGRRLHSSFFERPTQFSQHLKDCGDDAGKRLMTVSSDHSICTQ